jgi:hypothetical protein
MSKVTPKKPRPTGRLRIRKIAQPGADTILADHAEAKSDAAVSNATRDDTSAYEVGYGKPPKHSQYRKGQSGNSKGRPKGRKNMKTIIRAVLDQKLPIKINGKTRTVSGREMIALRLRQKAAEGEIKATQQLLKYDYPDEELEASTGSDQPRSKEVAEIDDLVLQEFERQIREEMAGVKDVERAKASSPEKGERDDSNT